MHDHFSAVFFVGIDAGIFFLKMVYSIVRLFRNLSENLNAFNDKKRKKW